MFHPTGNAGHLLIAGVDMNCPAWKTSNITDLWVDSPLRGEYVTTPGVDGADPVPMRATSAQWSLPFAVCGDVDHTGAPYAASGGYRGDWIGLRSNLNYLATNVLTGRTLTGNRTRTATLVTPGGTDLTAEIHAWLVPGGGNVHALRFTLEIRAAKGAFL